MKIEILGKKYNVSDRLSEIITKKLNKFERYFDESTKATVICKQENKGKYTMELTIKFSDGHIMRSEITSDNMYSNIDLILPKIEGQIRKYKTRLNSKIKNNAFQDNFIYGSDEKEDEKLEVVKTKKFDLMSISVDDAIAELDLVGNDFYVFFNKDAQRVNILYKRKDGELGLIDLNY
jgi:putative sigma-54 modulation protein